MSNTANTTIQVKKSGVSGNVPDSLSYGELGLNYADGILFYKSTDGTIRSISGSGGGGGGSGDSFTTINVSSSLILATSPTDTLSIFGSNGIIVTACTVTKSINVDGSGLSGGFPYIDLGYVTESIGPAPAIFDAGSLP